MGRFSRKAGFCKLLRLIIYYFLLRYLPSSATPIIGKGCRLLRYYCCKGIFLKCGKNVNIERKAFFSNGLELEIGDGSGIGISCSVPYDIKIGKNVMMGPNCIILDKNHAFQSIDIPMIQQGYTNRKTTIIEDDCWIGRDVLFTPGRTLSQGSIVAARCVLTKDFPKYSIIGGNPSKVIRTRLNE